MNPDNPKAFPLLMDDGMHNSGMTLRDYFAGQALCGIMADPGVNLNNLSAYRAIAEQSYGLADAMLTAREKKELS